MSRPKNFHDTASHGASRVKGKKLELFLQSPPTHHPRAELKSGCCSYFAGGVRALTLLGMSFPTNYFDMQKSHFFDHAFQGLPLSAVIRFFIRENHFPNGYRLLLRYLCVCGGAKKINCYLERINRLIRVVKKATMREN